MRDLLARFLTFDASLAWADPLLVAAWVVSGALLGGGAAMWSL